MPLPGDGMAGSVVSGWLAEIWAGKCGGLLQASWLGSVGPHGVCICSDALEGSLPHLWLLAAYFSSFVTLSLPWLRWLMFEVASSLSRDLDFSSGCMQVVIQLFRSGAVDQEWSRTGGRLLQCLAKPDDLDTGGTQVEREKHKTPMQVRTDLVS
ncbi:hypothetical protein G5714_016508 [Onychostoma macrolepis]|uniref:Uncharacterized protein n=1 Tax=Onychostoma macrolepis TaxID=369639 RepID=A0A7J6CAJ0_9TELE|nr:hypothetical protein G5714_016508 [Onychostoma macrolepis]